MRTFAPDGETLRAFMADHESRVKIIQGPVGSGTSSACCMHIWQQAISQPPQRDGKKRFRAHVFRETYPLLEETTVKTWLDWFPESTPHVAGAGRFYWTKPFYHEVRFANVELDVTFMAMEDIRDAKSYFKSLETSLIWFNEGQFAQFAVIQAAVERVSPPRYPAVKDGGCHWGGLIVDTNAPPADHWIPIMRGDVPPPDWMTEDQRRALKRPATWKFYLQPPGLTELFDAKGALVGYAPNPKAENLRYLHREGVDPLGLQNFYMEKIGGQAKQYIDANIMNRSTVVVDGQPVYPLFRRDAHVSPEPLEPMEGLPVVVGVDFGRQPAALMGQYLRGDWFIQREFIGRDISAMEFAPHLKAYLAQHYPGFTIQFWGDPAGGTRGQANDRTPFEVFRAHKLNVLPAPVPQNRSRLRQEAVNAVLLRRSATGRASALLVDPRCTTYITGMSGGYFIRRLQVSGERYAEEPDKGPYSHVCEAGEYMVIGGGEGRLLLSGSAEPKKPTNTRRPYNPFGQRHGALRQW